MTQRPIIFTGPMVRAILEGRKTQTRRVVKPQPIELVGEYRPLEWHWSGGPCLVEAGYGASYVHTDRDAMVRAMEKVCPYGMAGDGLWVRETWYNDCPSAANTEHLYYRADGTCCEQIPECQCASVGPVKWLPSIFMPRWASRITLRITRVRVQRLQDITEQDAQKEGMETVWEDGDRSSHAFGAWKNYGFETAHPKRGTSIVAEKHQIVGFQDATRSFLSLWDSINGKKYPWSSKPWVWVIEFERTKP